MQAVCNRAHTHGPLFPVESVTHAHIRDHARGASTVFELHLDADMSNDNLKDKIDNAADKAKDLADKAGTHIKDGADKVADKTHDAAEKIKQAGRDAGKKVGG
jgi:hypothetical protein